MKREQIMIVRHKGGTAQKTVPISQIVVPDLWHIAQAELDLDCRRAILETWHLAHDLKRHIETPDAPEPLEACKAVLAWIESHSDENWRHDHAEAADMLRDAITKATGQ